MHVANPPRPRLDYLDIFRGIAILAVIAIHVTSFPMVQLEGGTWQQFFYYFINSTSNYAVPSFLFLSGLVLFYNYFQRTQESGGWVAQFYKKRLLYILIPYIVWSFFYFAIVQFASGANPLSNLDSYFLKLLNWKNYTHLYYFIIILQFYALFPFILKWARSPVGQKLFIPIAAVVQIAFFLANLWFIHFAQTGILFITYFLHFCTGAYIGIHFERIIESLRRKTWLVAALLIVGLAGYVFAGRLYYELVPALLPFKSYLNFVIYYWFTLSAGIFLLLLSRWIYDTRGIYPIRRVLESIGAGSFAIFLAHPFFLLIWRQFVVQRYGAYYHYLTLAGGVVALAGSWLIYKLLSKGKRWTWVFIGK